MDARFFLFLVSACNLLQLAPYKQGDYNLISVMAKLRKSRTDKMLAGVCGGFAEYFGWDATIIRIIFALLIVSSFGTSILIYFILAIVMPD